MNVHLRQLNIAFLLALQVTVCFHVFAQRSTPQRPNTQTQGRDVMVKPMSGGAALNGHGKLWAVVIGVSSYKNLAKQSQLEYAHRDAEDFAAFLRSPNGGGYPPSQLTLLTNQTATLSAIRSALGTILPRSVEPDDTVVIFFAGHGVVEGERDGYLLAYDSDPQNLYATALQISELNRIVSDRLKARNVILIADACHSGRLGLTSRNVNERAVLVNTLLNEVGKSGRGVFGLLGSRPDQLSYEGSNWGGGHGAFTYYLLEGLRGKADQDHDGFVRVGELLDYVSKNVSNDTKALQIPRASGDIDATLPMSIISAAASKGNTTNTNNSINVSAPPKPPPTQLCAVEIHGASGLQIYVDNTLVGNMPPSGKLVIRSLSPGDHEIATDSNGQTTTQKISLTQAYKIVTVNGGSASINRPPADRTTSGGTTPPTLKKSGSGGIGNGSLASQISQALKNNDNNGAFILYQRLVRESPNDPQRSSLEASLISALETTGQNAISVYIHSSGREIRQGMFQESANAFQKLKVLAPNDDKFLDAKLKFCEGQVLMEKKQFSEAAEQFKSAVQLDPRASHYYSALGMAFRNLNDDDKGLEALKRATELAQDWALPQIQIGFLYLDKGDMVKAKEAFKNAAAIDPSYPKAQEEVIFICLKTGQLNEAEDLANSLIRKFPDSGAGYLWLGEIYERTGQWARATKAYEKGLALPVNITQAQRIEFNDRLKRCRKNGK